MTGSQPNVSYQPSAEELANAEAAKETKLNTLQDTAKQQTERLYRLFGAGAALSGSGSAPILSGL